VFQHVKGVTNAVSGYAGGEKRTAEYERSAWDERDTPNPQVTYDPRQISYGRLLQIFLWPTIPQSSIDRVRMARTLGDLPATAEQADVAKAHRPARSGACVQEVDRHENRTDRAFYPAEAYHWIS
jgi:peptide-methionine (S)-S-oxide reductase